MKNLQLAVMLGVCLCALSACAKKETPAESPVTPEPAAVSASSESVTAAFRAFLDENYAVDMDRAPYTASYRGIKTHHDQWDSVAESHLEETRAINEARLLELAEFDRSALDPSAHLSWDLYRLGLQRQIASASKAPANDNAVARAEAKRLATQQLEAEARLAKLEVQTKRKIEELAALQSPPKPKSNIPADINFGNYHALVIGIDKYENLKPLKNAVADAEAVAKTLTESYGFTVTKLINPRGSPS